MNDVSIIVPIANYHSALAERALESAAAQTIACDIISVTDNEMKGAGWARNRALETVDTRFTVFLDADDQIAPTFVERCLSVWKSNHYVYTDWNQEDGVHRASDDPWQLHNGEWHVITSLIPTDAIKRVGGFDERVRGGEDTLLWWALTRSGVCGIALHENLFTYGAEGRRAREFIASPDYRPTMLGLIERYGEAMCCGGEGLSAKFVPTQPGDIEALAIWGGNRQEYGVITGRLYPRGGNGNPMSVDPRDVDASPEKWVRVRPSAPVIAQPVKPAVQPNVYQQLPTNTVLDGVGELVAAVHGVAVVKTAAELRATLPPEPKAPVKPNVSGVRKLAGKGKK